LVTTIFQLVTREKNFTRVTSIGANTKCTIHQIKKPIAFLNVTIHGHLDVRNAAN